MFKNQKLEELYQLASSRDSSHTIDAYTFLLENVELPSEEEFELLLLIINMYSNIPSLDKKISNLIRSIVQYNILNLLEMKRILLPYKKCMEEHKEIGKPLAFCISHELETTDLTRERVENKERFCTLRIFLSQLSSNLVLTNEFENFCIHSNVIDDIKKNGNHDNDFLENIVIDLSQCEGATVGYLCEHWLYGEYKRGRILPNPSLKHHIEYFCEDK